MDFDLSDEQRAMIRTAERVVARFGLDYWRDLDRRHAFPHEIWAEICRAGLAGVAVPEAYGGAGLGMVDLALVIEELAAAGAGATVGQLFMNNAIFGGLALARFGPEPMRRALLPRLVAGEAMFCMALTEPDAGTNSLAITTRAEPEGTGYRIRGRKIWITGVPEAQKMLVVARTTPLSAVARRTEGITLFMIDRARPGVGFSPVDKCGTHTLTSSLVELDDVRAEREEVIGTPDAGWGELLDILNTERIVTTAGLIGTVRLALRLACDYARTRRVFGDRPIGSYQALQFPLAEAHAKAACARLMNLRAASLHDAGRPYGSEANIAKLVAGHAAQLATDRAVQTLGGMGYARESHVERLWRDARLFRIAPISEEMILNFIAQHDLALPRSY